jgi:thiamine-phosphate pyrophosphorylase
MLQRLQPIVQGARAKLLVHSDVELALAFKVDGLHLASAVQGAPVRAQLTPQMLLGVSRHGCDPLDTADIGCADYATIGPVYRPTSKPNDRREPLGLEGLRACCQRSVQPLVALGGLRPGRAAETLAQGAVAIAISGAILQAKDPAEMLQQLCAELDQHRY